MATEVKSRPGTIYDADFYLWALEQAAAAAVLDTCLYSYDRVTGDWSP